jgi:hypothetical protein
MSSGSASIRFLTAAISLFALLLGACSTRRCPTTPADKCFLQINHFSGGEAPVVYALEVYKNGVVRLNKVGFRAYCSKVEEARLSRLKSLVNPDRLSELEWSPQAGMDWRMAQIQAGNAEVRVVLEEPPQELRPLLESVDALFDDLFGRRYDMPLLAD